MSSWWAAMMRRKATSSPAAADCERHRDPCRPAIRVMTPIPHKRCAGRLLSQDGGKSAGISRPRSGPSRQPHGRASMARSSSDRARSIEEPRLPLGRIAAPVEAAHLEHQVLQLVRVHAVRADERVERQEVRQLRRGPRLDAAGDVPLGCRQPSACRSVIEVTGGPEAPLPRFVLHRDHRLAQRVAVHVHDVLRQGRTLVGHAEGLVVLLGSTPGRAVAVVAARRRRRCSAARTPAQARSFAGQGPWRAAGDGAGVPGLARPRRGRVVVRDARGRR